MTLPDADARASQWTDEGPLADCPRCHGSGECSNAQFRCACRWHRKVCALLLGNGDCDCPRPSEVRKAIYIGAPACFALEEALRPVCEAFGTHCCYIVGSALQRQDWRDVDVRLMLPDDEFAAEFPDAHDGHWEQDTRWLLFIVCISERLSRLTGLPVDFQIQPMTHANKRHSGPRSAAGLRLARKETHRGE